MGAARRGGRVVYMSNSIVRAAPADASGRTAAGGATLERTSAHEFGHTAGLDHPAAGTRPNNLMNQTSAADAGLVIEEADVFLMETNFNNGLMNHPDQGVDPRTL
jgi:hypothetical protein